MPVTRSSMEMVWYGLFTVAAVCHSPLRMDSSSRPSSGVICDMNDWAMLTAPVAASLARTSASLNTSGGTALISSGLNAPLSSPARLAVGPQHGHGHCHSCRRSCYELSSWPHCLLFSLSSLVFRLPPPPEDWNRWQIR